MNNEIRTLSLDPITIGKLVLSGDMKGLTPAQQVDYYSYRCQQAGLDPAAKPFDILTLNGKTILYANAACTQQLTSIHKLSHTITSRELVDGIYCVFCKVTGPDGRSTENMGAVPVDSLKGEAKANAYLKATTKAIRRTVLAHCGLGMMDETETVTIPGAKAETWVEPSEDVPVVHEWTEDDRQSLFTAFDCLYDTAERFGLPESKATEAINFYKSQMSAGEDPQKVLNRVFTFTQAIEAKAKKVPA